MSSKNCKNCDTPLHGPICHECGQSVFDERWSVTILVKQFINQLTNIEKGFFFTIKALFTFPGKLINDYWSGKTVLYYNPFRYVLILTALNLLINFWLGIDDMLQASLQPEAVEKAFGEEAIKSADQRFDSWMNILVLLLIPINSLVTGILFKNSKKNYAEHLILNSYILGQQGLISAVTQFIFYFFPILFSGYFLFYFVVGLVYDSYVFRQTFKEKWGSIILKSLVKGITGILALFSLILLFSAIAIAFSS